MYHENLVNMLCTSENSLTHCEVLDLTPPFELLMALDLTNGVKGDL